MKWRYKFEAQMDCNDADYAKESGELGEFDDTKEKDMLKVHLQMLFMNCYADIFDDGYANDDKVMTHFYKEAHKFGIKDKELEKFIKKDLIHDYQWLPNDPNDDSYAHDLYFTFYRIPADIDEESVDADDITNYIKRKPIKEEKEEEDDDDGLFDGLLEKD